MDRGRLAVVGFPSALSLMNVKDHIVGIAGLREQPVETRKG